jgi:hypothetical protein
MVGDLERRPSPLVAAHDRHDSQTTVGRRWQAAPPAVEVARLPTGFDYRQQQGQALAQGAFRLSQEDESAHA